MRWLLLLMALPLSAADVYVSASAAATGDGSRERPYRTISNALANAKATRVLVAAGLYEEHDLPLRQGVTLEGGYDPSNWQRDGERFRSVIDALKRGRVLRCAGGAKVDGFVIRGGRVRGHGGAVLCSGANPSFTNNIFEENETLGPQPWNPKNLHEDANDGGAVACIDGCRAVFEGNVFVHNRTANGRGGALAVVRSSPSIRNNVFLENVSGVDDPMRSSDGGAVSIYDRSHPEFAGNQIIGNRALNRNDGGGVFVALWSAPRIEGNTFTGNFGGDDAGALFVGGQKHHYGTPLDPVPPAAEFTVVVSGNTFGGNTNSSMNSGAFRITMESRVRFTGNTLIDNAGAYFQRSWITASGNAIYDNVLLVEEKEGSDAPRKHSAAPPRPVTVTAKQAFYDPLRYRTKIEAPLPPFAMLQAGDTWTVVKNGFAWGDVSRFRSFQVHAIADASAKSQWTPKRINKSIELLESGQPIYYAEAYGGYEEGRKLAKTWADYINYNMEHAPLDFTLLREFMRGLVDGGPTPSGHRTPTVIVVLPALGLDSESMLANGWMIQQALAQGVHGVHLGRARDPEAVKRFVQSARYPFAKQGADLLGAGTRGWGSQVWAAHVWGVDQKTYLQIADVWPLNPKGEIMLGLKIEDHQALERARETLAVPGIAFAEHGPRDMGLSYGYLEGRADPPVPKEVDAAGRRVLELCKKYGVAFLDNVLPDNVEKRIDEGVRIGAGRRQDSAEKGRKYTRRQMPW